MRMGRKIREIAVQAPRRPFLKARCATVLPRLSSYLSAHRDGNLPPWMLLCCIQRVPAVEQDIGPSEFVVTLGCKVNKSIASATVWWSATTACACSSLILEMQCSEMAQITSASSSPGLVNAGTWPRNGKMHHLAAGWSLAQHPVTSQLRTRACMCRESFMALLELKIQPAARLLCPPARQAGVVPVCYAGEADWLRLWISILCF